MQPENMNGATNIPLGLLGYSKTQPYYQPTIYPGIQVPMMQYSHQGYHPGMYHRYVPSHTQSTYQNWNQGPHTNNYSNHNVSYPNNKSQSNTVEKSKPKIDFRKEKVTNVKDRVRTLSSRFKEKDSIFLGIRSLIKYGDHPHSSIYQENSKKLEEAMEVESEK